MIHLHRPASGFGRDATAARRVIAISMLVVAAGLPVAGYCQSSAETSWEAIKTCASIKDDKARFTCYDAVVRGAGLLPTAAELHRDTFGLPQNAAGPAPVPKAADAPPPPVAAAATTAPKAAATASVATGSPFADTGIHAPAASPAQLDVVIAKVDESYDSKATITTTDGAVWTQVESGVLRQPPAKGDTMTITQGSFGGFMCKSSKYVTFRCRRMR